MDTKDLRTAISAAVMFGSTRRALDRVLADPEHQAELLDAMGLDVIPTGQIPLPFIVVRPRG